MNTDYLRRPRLLVLSSTWPARGADGQWHGPVFVRELAQRLTTWFDVCVLVPHRAGLPLLEQDEGLQVQRYRYAPAALQQLAYGAGIAAQLREARWRWLLVPGFLLAQVLAIRRLRRTWPADVVHAHWLIPQGVAAAVAASLSLPGGRMAPPLACTCHGTDIFGFNGGAAQYLKRFALRRTPALAVVSHGLASALTTRLGQVGEERPPAILPMGVDLQSRFVPRASAPPVAGTAGALPAATRDPLAGQGFVLFVGRLIPFKGVEVLIDAAARLVRQRPDLQVRIAGQGPLRAALEARVARQGLQHCVAFLGAVPQQALPALYQAAAVCVVPSVRTAEGHEEALGLVMVEALGCGCPVIGSDLPGMADVLQHEQTALTFPAGDAHALAGALDRLLGDPALADRLAQQGRAHALQGFDWPVVAARYAGWLGGLLPLAHQVRQLPDAAFTADRLATVTVTWQPDLALLQAQLQVLPAACLKVLVDNGSPPALQAALAQLAGRVPNVRLLCNAHNAGLAAALNQGVRQLGEAVQPADFVLLLDQDSVPQPGCVDALLAGWRALQGQGVPVGAVGPVLRDPDTGLTHGFHQMRSGRWTRCFPPATSRVPVPCASLNGSGTLLPRTLFDACGGLEAGLFIDHVDTEWSFRLVAAGYQLFGLPQAEFSHRMGDASRRLWLFGWRVWPQRSPQRHYFLFRNAVALLRRRYVPLVWKTSAVVKLLVTVAVTLVLGPGRLAQCRAMARGIRHGLRLPPAPGLGAPSSGAEP